MTLTKVAVENYLSKKTAECRVVPGSLRSKAKRSLREAEKENGKAKSKGLDPAYYLSQQPKSGIYRLTNINRNSTGKTASLKTAAFFNYIEKTSGGPGSGSADSNTLPINYLPQSKLMSIGKRSDFMNGNTPKEKGVTVLISKIRYVCQKNMVPKKVVKMMSNDKVLDFPIDLLVDKDGDFHVMDGHHRYIASFLKGRKTLKANVWDGSHLDKLSEKISYTLSPSAMKPGKPASVGPTGIKKNLRLERGAKGSMLPGTVSNLKPFVDNDAYVRQHLADNPFLG